MNIQTNKLCQNNFVLIKRDQDFFPEKGNFLIKCPLWQSVVTCFVLFSWILCINSLYFLILILSHFTFWIPYRAKGYSPTMYSYPGRMTGFVTLKSWVFATKQKTLLQHSVIILLFIHRYTPLSCFIQHLSSIYFKNINMVLIIEFFPPFFFLLISFSSFSFEHFDIFLHPLPNHFL